jgi:Flp pilus assembly protein TadG
MSRMRWISLMQPAVLRRLAADRSGVSAIITAIALTTLAGFGGLAVDVVMWEVNQRTLQGAADQAALAAATAYRNAGETDALGDSTTAQNAAYATAIRNNYPAASITVAAYNNGSTCTNDGCIQVSISQQQPRYFTGVFTSSSFTESASAVGTCSGCGNGSYAANDAGGNPCVMALDGGGKGVITDTGGSSLSLAGCNLYNNAPNTDATIVNNNAVIEGCSVSNPCGSMAFLAQPNNPGGIDVPVVTSASPAPDPFAGVTPPTVASTCHDFSAYASPSGSTTNFVNVASGTYCPGNINGDTVTFATGAVIVINQNNGLDTHGNNNTNLSGTGVTLYVLGGGNINANTVLNISAPTSGPYAGLALWFGDTNNVSYAGSNSGTFKGAIYAPKADVSYSGNGGSTSTCTRLIAGSIDLSGGSVASFDNTGCPVVAGPVLTSSGISGSTPNNGSPILIQ